MEEVWMNLYHISIACPTSLSPSLCKIVGSKVGIIASSSNGYIVTGTEAK